LRIRVHNKGYRILHNCSASLRVIIPKDVDEKRYPSDDSKLLAWGRSADKSDLTTSRNIQAHSNELLFVVFSDSDFPNQRIEDAPTRYASIGILERLKSNELRVEDSFTNGEFIVEIIITSDEGQYTKGKFRINVGKNWRDLTMKNLSPSERLKAKLNSLFTN
jgi:hypothetical protein